MNTNDNTNKPQGPQSNIAKTLKVMYHGGNSGGRAWMTQEDAKELSDWRFVSNFPGLITFGCLKTTKTIMEVLNEFQGVVGSIDDDGCECCSSPHAFTWWECVCDEIVNVEHGKHCKCSGENAGSYASGSDVRRAMDTMEPANAMEDVA